MRNHELLQVMLDAIERGDAVARVAVVAGEGAGAWALVRRHDAPGWERLGASEVLLHRAREALELRRHATITDEQRTYWIEVLGTLPTLLIVGAGHLAQPLAQLGKLCDFRVVILDDRARYANRERFPEADEVIAAPFTETLREYPLDADTYIVLVTRGHSHDVESLMEVLDRPHAYVGMVGSKRRVGAVWKLLEAEKGIARERLGRVYSPIGLDIGAESPAEIAVAIMAEIIMVRRGGRGEPLSDALRGRGGRVHQGRIGRARDRESGRDA